MAKHLQILLVAGMAVLFLLSGCSNSKEKTNPSADGDMEYSEQESNTESESEIEPEYPDPNFTYGIRTHQDKPPAEDSPYLAEETTYYRTEDKLPDTNVNSIVNIDGTIFAASNSGLEKYDATQDLFVNVVLSAAEPTIAITKHPDADGCIYIAHQSSVEIICPEIDGTTILNSQTLKLDDDETLHSIDIASASGIMFVGTSKALITCYMGDDSSFNCQKTNTTETNDLIVLQDATNGNIKLLAAQADSLNLYQYTSEDQTPNPSSIATSEGAFTAVAVCPDGKWIAGATDKFVYNDSDDILSAKEMHPELHGLPEANITSLSCNENWYLIGHEIGVTAFKRDFSHKDHYISQRWMLNNHANSVLLGDNDSRWIATSDGITRIDFVERTAYQKAQIMHQELDDYYWRMDGFVCADVYTETPWSMDGLYKRDFDNDGLWTQMMIGAFTMAYAVTGDSYYCEEARKAIKVMMLQIDVPCESFKAAGKECGFVTRSLVRDDEGAIFEDKADKDNWHLVEYKGHQYYWKDDTSSDETTGHFFGYPLYFDMCATEEEKQEIAEHVGKLASYIVDNGFYLIDLDGEKTTYGHWAPEWIGICVNGIADCLDTAEDPGLCFSACYGGGWLNSLEILGHMLAAWHITGNKKFYDAYDMLITKYHYDKIAQFSEDVYTCTRRNFQNHSDHELAILAYHTLIRYEPNEERRQKWIESLLGFYQTELPERNPLWAAFVAGLAGKDYDQENAVRTIREMPLDRRYWLFDNSHRQDYEVDRKKGRHDELQFTEVPPYDEIRSMWWNGNPYAVITGGNSKEITGPMAYLLAYWSMRYYGLLDGPTQER